MKRKEICYLYLLFSPTFATREQHPFKLGITNHCQRRFNRIASYGLEIRELGIRKFDSRKECQAAETYLKHLWKHKQSPAGGGTAAALSEWYDLDLRCLERFFFLNRGQLIVSHFLPTNRCVPGSYNDRLTAFTPGVSPQERFANVMSFFAQNAEYSTGGGEFEPAEAGDYKCRFRDVESFTEPSFEDKTKMEKRFRWRFESVEDVDSKNNPYRFSIKTGIRYGNDRAGITILLDSMLGRRLTQEEFAALDLADFRDRLWTVVVDAKPGNDGKIWNNIQSVTPVRQRRQAPPQAQAQNQNFQTAQQPASRPAPAPQGNRSGGTATLQRPTAPQVGQIEDDEEFQDPFDNDGVGPNATF